MLSATKRVGNSTKIGKGKVELDPKFAVNLITNCINNEKILMEGIFRLKIL